MPIEIPCHRCAACCRWPGEVRLDNDEITSIATFLGLGETDFIERHMRLRRDRRGLAFNERSDGSCIFLDGKNCAIQPVKPKQCREFPNRWVNSLWGKMPIEVIRRDYPMLANCQAFQKFVETSRG